MRSPNSAFWKERVAELEELTNEKVVSLQILKELSFLKKMAEFELNVRKSEK
ncbi:MULTISPECIES: hypothetical protein [unclassified Enterococcus]|uniref:hypothetical protein n=1 Tax=unclassified Enterococcus TaxID=2608891 RepID=UPI001A9AE510|nr:hypothetical protein [Enterococcus sp. DIV1271a]MBO1299610.1 hypothetical protein [Enterococcus sp. DIV1271a]